MRAYDRKILMRRPTPWVPTCSKAQLMAEIAAEALGGPRGTHVTQLRVWIRASADLARDADQRMLPGRPGWCGWMMVKPGEYPCLLERLWKRLPPSATRTIGPWSPTLILQSTRLDPVERVAMARAVARKAIAAFRAQLLCPHGAESPRGRGWRQPKIIVPVRIVAHEPSGKFVALAVNSKGRLALQHGAALYRFRQDSTSRTGWRAARVAKPGEYMAKIESQRRAQEEGS